MKKLIYTLLMMMFLGASWSYANTQTPAANVSTNTSKFNRCLNYSDTNVQTSLDDLNTCFSTGTSFLPPSALVGLSVVNGTSSSAIRSDSSPALSQAITPTWTGMHIFRGSPSIVTSGNIGVGSLTPGEALDINGTARMIGFTLTSGASNGYILVSNNIGVGTWQSLSTEGVTTVTASSPLASSGGSAPNISVSSSTGSGAIVLQSSPEFLGNIGIGSVNPTQKLDILGRLAIGGTQSLYLPTGYTNTLILGNGGNSLTHSSLDQGYYNTLIGLLAGNTISSGYYNTLIGSGSDTNINTGYSNSAVGMYSLYNNSSGHDNIAIGVSAGRNYGD